MSDMSEWRPGTKVTFSYQGTLSSGEIFDEQNEQNPLSIEIGKASILPSFLKHIEGMQIHEERSFTIPADEAYGAYQEGLLFRVHRNKLPQDMDIQEGLCFTLEEGSDSQNVMVRSIDGDSILLDLNHPLAGHHLTYKVKILEIAQHARVQ